MMYLQQACRFQNMTSRQAALLSNGPARSNSLSVQRDFTANIEQILKLENEYILVLYMNDRHKIVCHVKYR